MKNKLLTGLLGFFIAILIITFSIGLPIYFRPFYYMQIDTLNIEAYSGADREIIVEAYNELLDYTVSLPDLVYNIQAQPVTLHFADTALLTN